jgi:NAD(P)H-dependent FMN reductase
MKKIVVLSGSIRNGRKSHFVAELIMKQLQENESVKSILLDLKAYPFPVMEMRMNATETVPKGLPEFSNQLSSADGIIIVSPEYKNGIPGALKNALDYLDPQVFKHISLGIVTVSSGGFGGVNCLSQLRLVGLALGGIPIPEKLCVSYVNDLFNDTGNLRELSFTLKITEFTQHFLGYVDRLSI